MFSDEEDKASEHDALTKSQPDKGTDARIDPFIAGLLVGVAIIAMFAAIPLFAGIIIWVLSASLPIRLQGQVRIECACGNPKRN